MKTLELEKMNLIELSQDETTESNGGWVLAILGTVGAVVSGVWAIGFVAGAAYAVGEKVYNEVSN